MVLNSLKSSLMLHGPLNRLRMHSQRLDNISDRLILAISTRLHGAALALNNGRDRLEALSPVAVLKRGFSIVRKGGLVVRGADEVTAGDELDLTFGSGGATASVTQVKAVEHD